MTMYIQVRIFKYNSDADKTSLLHIMQLFFDNK